MSQSLTIKTDAEFAASLLSLVDDSIRHQLLMEMAKRVANIVLVSAADADEPPIPIPLCDDGAVDTTALVESFLEDVRPPHEGHAYLDDHWNFIWEQAWPEGIADAVLGSEAFDCYAAADLMEEVERQAEDIGLPEAPSFDVDDLEDFVKTWRSRFIDELSKVKAGT